MHIAMTRRVVATASGAFAISALFISSPAAADVPCKGEHGEKGVAVQEGDVAVSRSALQATVILFAANSHHKVTVRTDSCTATLR